jgi:hypothetical protein
MLNPFSLNSCLIDLIQELTIAQQHPRPTKKPAIVHAGLHLTASGIVQQTKTYAAQPTS